MFMKKFRRSFYSESEWTISIQNLWKCLAIYSYYFAFTFAHLCIASDYENHQEEKYF